MAIIQKRNQHLMTIVQRPRQQCELKIMLQHIASGFKSSLMLFILCKFLQPKIDALFREAEQTVGNLLWAVQPSSRCFGQCAERVAHDAHRLLRTLARIVCANVLRAALRMFGVIGRKNARLILRVSTNCSSAKRVV